MHVSPYTAAMKQDKAYGMFFSGFLKHFFSTKALKADSVNHETQKVYLLPMIYATAPLFSSAVAIINPMPEPPPVTTATKSIMISIEDLNQKPRGVVRSNL